jgi:hypothetical protein
MLKKRKQGAKNRQIQLEETFEETFPNDLK